MTVYEFYIKVRISLSLPLGRLRKTKKNLEVNLDANPVATLATTELSELRIVVRGVGLVGDAWTSLAKQVVGHHVNLEGVDGLECDSSIQEVAAVEVNFVVVLCILRIVLDCRLPEVLRAYEKLVVAEVLHEAGLDALLGRNGGLGVAVRCALGNAVGNADVGEAREAHGCDCLATDDVYVLAIVYVGADVGVLAIVEVLLVDLEVVV